MVDADSGFEVTAEALRSGRRATVRLMLETDLRLFAVPVVEVLLPTALTVLGGRLVAAAEEAESAGGLRPPEGRRLLVALGLVAAVFLLREVVSSRLAVIEGFRERVVAHRRDRVMAAASRSATWCRQSSLSGQGMNQLASATDNANRAAWTLTAVRRYVWLLDYAAGRRASAGSGHIAPPERLTGGIRLESLTFGYPSTDVEVLRDVDLCLPAGRTVPLPAASPSMASIRATSSPSPHSTGPAPPTWWARCPPA